MKKKRYITYFLFFISMVMLAVPVIPHHHHSDGLVCMKDDLAANCCEHRHTPADKHCCNTGCVTTNIVQQTPSSDNDAWAHPNIPWTVTLFFESISKLLVLSENDLKRQDRIYIEFLHGTCITRATGLRAPPYALLGA